MATLWHPVSAAGIRLEPWFVFTVLLLVMAVSACNQSSSEKPKTDNTATISTADLPGIKARGEIRYARTRWGGFDTLPTQGLPAEAYQRIAERYAERNGWRVQWITLDGSEALLDAVVEGRADVAVSNLTVTQSREARVAFTKPVTSIHEWLLGKGNAISDVSQLEHAVLGVPGGTAYLDTIATTAALATAQLKLLPPSTSPEEVVSRLLSGNFDYTIMDDNTARPLLQEEPELKHLYTFPKPVNLAWGIHRNNPQLKSDLDNFLIESHVNAQREVLKKRSLAEIRSAGRVRMLTVNGPASYFLWRGELMGFDYDLMKYFAESEKLDLEVVVVPSSGDLIDWLQQGRGDVISASVTATPEREARGVAFSRAYLKVQETFVSSPGVEPIEALQDLQGRTLIVNPSTHYWQSLTKLKQEKGLDFTLQRTALSTEEILTGIGNGRFANTLADSHLIEIEIAFRDAMKKGMALQGKSSLVWAVNPENKELLEALNRFLKKHYRDLRYNVIRRKYFHNEKRMRDLRADRLSGGRLSPWDDLVREQAREESFDWRLIVAQIYQESQFDPKAHSFAGARGLLQVLPRTAKELDIDPDRLVEPETGIRAGVEYLAWTRDRFPADIILDERLWFSLASYNAGVGHVRDARSIARRKGWNPNQWFGSVENSMLLLSRPEYWKKSRHGFVRGREPVNYVRAIRRRYEAYIDYLTQHNAQRTSN